MVSNWGSYENFSSSVLNFGDRDGYTSNYSDNIGQGGGFYGSEQLWSSAGGSSGISDAASVVMVAENNYNIPRNNSNENNNDNNNGLSSEEEVPSLIREKIASHPLYPELLKAYIDCRKVGSYLS